jgi:transcriptional regulator with XRE-family HTH domain
MGGASSSSPDGGAAVQGRALAVLRLSRGFTRLQLAQAARVTPSNLSSYERGLSVPQQATLDRLLDAMGLPPEAIERAKTFAVYPLGQDGTLPPDVRAPQRPQESDVSRAAALKLAQEVGKAFAHVTLAFLELKAGGWRLPRD